jgi:hypothetical protein
MQSNTRRKPADPIFTHEGARAAHITPIQQLRRSVLACLLWERSFYESGQDIGERIKSLVGEVIKRNGPGPVAHLAVEARTKHHLRHVPLLLIRELARHGGGLVSSALNQTIQRADELAEFLAIYWADGRTPISKQVRKGLALAFRKFDAYQLAKYNRDKAITLRDVMFLVHPQPLDEAQAAVWAKLANNELEAPDTWEVALSGGADKRAAFTRLLLEDKLGYLALLRNLRNMEQAKVDPQLIQRAILARKGAGNVLPFRYIAAVRAAPMFAQQLDAALKACIEGSPKLPGRTAVLVDVSGSMGAPLSAKSDLRRIDAAAALASVTNGDSVRTFVFNTHAGELPTYPGLAGVETIVRQCCGGTDLAAGLALTDKAEYDRLIVITDEQSRTMATPQPRVPGARHYLINVGVERNGIGYGQPWVHLDGFSESILRWIAAHEDHAFRLMHVGEAMARW